MKEVLIYGKSDQQCAHCKEAKKVLSERGIPFVFIDVSKDEAALMMLKESGFRSVPQIYIDGVHIGDSTCAKTLEV